MTELVDKNSMVLGQKRGVPIYASNPSIPAKEEISKPRRTRIGTAKKGIIFEETGEVMEPTGHGGALVYEWEEVDKDRFVKLFLGGIKQASGLSKAGLMMFEVVYNQLRQSPNTDRIELNYFLAQNCIPKLSDRTFRRGLRELLDKEFLYRSPSENLYFVNIRYMFNGDRLGFVKGYYLKGTPSPIREPEQLSFLKD